LILVIVILESILWGISHFLNADWKEIAFLSMRMLPGLLFICLYALNSAFLQTQKKYFLSGFAPVLFNLSWILIAFLVCQKPIQEATEMLSFGITFAFFLQWLATFLQTHRLNAISWSEWFRPHFFSVDLKKMLKPISFGVIGVGATQLNSALDAIFARFSDLSGPAYLWYAIRIEQLPLALFGIALSGALLPPLSRAMQEGAMNRYQDLLYKALRYSALLIVPCAFGLFALGGPGINLLYGHGDFTTSDVRQTFYCLWAYGLGLLPSVMILLLATGFYAKKSYAIPTYASLVSVVFHIGLNSLFVFCFDFGAFSIALSTSCAAFLNCSILMFFSQAHVVSEFWRFLIKIILCGIFATVTTIFLGATGFGDVTFTTLDFSRSFSTQFIQLLGMGFWFAATYIGCIYSFVKFRRIEI
jgi:putative peptidoglycan lipid II flippase